MTLAKAVVSGVVFKAPEERFTQNGVAVYGLTLNIDENEETLIRVIAKRRALAEVLDRVNRGDKIVVDGRLQVAVSKSPEGVEKRFYEIDANEIEIISGSSSTSTRSSSAPAVEAKEENLVKFAETDYTEDSLVDDEEIPF
jgi:single-stranded DNA-binding protein